MSKNDTFEHDTAASVQAVPRERRMAQARLATNWGSVLDPTTEVLSEFLWGLSSDRLSEAVYACQVGMTLERADMKRAKRMRQFDRLDLLKERMKLRRTGLAALKRVVRWFDHEETRRNVQLITHINLHLETPTEQTERLAAENMVPKTPAGKVEHGLGMVERARDTVESKEADIARAIAYGDRARERQLRAELEREKESLEVTLSYQTWLETNLAIGLLGMDDTFPLPLLPF